MVYMANLGSTTVVIPFQLRFILGATLNLGRTPKRSSTLRTAAVDMSYSLPCTFAHNTAFNSRTALLHLHGHAERLLHKRH
jgi:hypothetical protein